MSKEVKIAVLGRRSSGKTVFLSVLLHELKPEHNEFGWDLIAEPSTLAIEEKGYLKDIYIDHVLPGSTNPAAVGPPVSYFVSIPGWIPLFYPIPWHPKFNLKLFDSSGEDSEHQEAFDKANPHLRNCDGMIVLVSALSLPQFSHNGRMDPPNAQFLDILYNHFNQDRIKMPTAFVLTKTDVLRDRDVLKQRCSAYECDLLLKGGNHSEGFDLSHCKWTTQVVDALVAKQDSQAKRENVFGPLPRRFVNYEIFGVSSLGGTTCILDKETEDGRVPIDPEKIYPINLFSPLFWILHKLRLMVCR